MDNTDYLDFVLEKKKEEGYIQAVKDMQDKLNFLMAELKIKSEITNDIRKETLIDVNRQLMRLRDASDDRMLKLEAV